MGMHLIVLRLALRKGGRTLIWQAHLLESILQCNLAAVPNNSYGGAGSATVSADRKVVNLTGGGYCGGCGPVLNGSSGPLLFSFDSVLISTQAPPYIAGIQAPSAPLAQGANTNLTVAVGGAAPLYYQWYLNGALVSGATGASLNIPAASTNSVGNYQVVVWNSAGTNWSSTAALWLNNLQMYAGVNAFGPIGGTCQVQYATNLNTPVTWVPLQTATIVTNPTVIIDYGSAGQPQRFYQTVPQ